MNKDTKEFFAALKVMEEERGIPQEYLAEKIANAIIVALRKDYGGRDVITCIVDPQKMVFSVTVRKTVVDELTDVYSEILKEEAVKKRSAGEGRRVERQLKRSLLCPFLLSTKDAFLNRYAKSSMQPRGAPP